MHAGTPNLKSWRPFSVPSKQPPVQPWPLTSSIEDPPNLLCHLHIDPFLGSVRPSLVVGVHLVTFISMAAAMSFFPCTRSSTRSHVDLNTRKEGICCADFGQILGHSVMLDRTHQSGSPPEFCTTTYKVCLYSSKYNSSLGCQSITTSKSSTFMRFT